MKKYISFLLLFPFLMIAGFSLVAQDTIDMKKAAKEEKNLKNVVRASLTNPLIFGGRTMTLGYERMVGDYQSSSINGGLTQIPAFDAISIADDSIVQLFKDSKDKGFNITGDYRFYLATENKHKAPHGVYIAPYFSYLYMGRENKWNLNSATSQGEVNSDFHFNVISVGGELGYQFVLWKRLVIDCVLIGPSVSRFSLEANLDTNLSSEDEALIYEKINDFLTEKFPGYTFSVDDVDFERTGSNNNLGLGYRYNIHLGYRF